MRAAGLEPENLSNICCTTMHARCRLWLAECATKDRALDERYVQYVFSCPKYNIVYYVLQYPGWANSMKG